MHTPNSLFCTSQMLDQPAFGTSVWITTVDTLKPQIWSPTPSFQVNMVMPRFITSCKLHSCCLFSIHVAKILLFSEVRKAVRVFRAKFVKCEFRWFEWMKMTWVFLKLVWKPSWPVANFNLLNFGNSYEFLFLRIFVKKIRTIYEFVPLCFWWL